MDFSAQIKALAAKIPNLLPHIQSEATTQTALVEPFIRALGYDTSDPTEVVPEFGANLDLPGVKKDKHVDYGIILNGQPIILIEVKPYGKDPSVGNDQLYDYFSKIPELRIGVATNGVIYRFYADLEKTHLLDKTPFLEIDMLNLKDLEIEQLKKLTKSAFNVENVITAANELKYIGGILSLLNEQLKNPYEDFVKFFFKQLCPDKSFSGGVKSEFAAYTQRALKQFIGGQISNLLEASGFSGSSVNAPQPTTPVDDSKTTADDTPIQSELENRIETTETELEGFYIVKSILRQLVYPNRIVSRDVVSYFGILLDDNKLKPICRLYFNNPENKRIVIFKYTEAGRLEEKFPIQELNDIYNYAEELKATVEYYKNQ